MLWSFFWQPVTIEASGLIPLFVLPMCGVMGSNQTCHLYFTENTGLFILGGMLNLLMNNSGVDRRIATWFLCSGDTRQFSGKRLVYKASAAAFFLSMWCNKLIVTSNLIDTVSRVLTNLQSATSRSRGSEANYDEMRYIVNNAIQTSSSIGCIGVIHSSFSILFFRTIWCKTVPKGMEYPDIFNYLQYTCFAIPVALVIFLLNVYYHMLLIDTVIDKPMSEFAMSELSRSFKEQKDALPKKIGGHEKASVFFTALAFLVFVFRWCKWLNMGWSTFRRETVSPEIPGIKDATVAALFVCSLHILPKTLGFTKYLTIKKKSELKPIKPESAILWWSFVNKNVNYGYMFLLGSGVALSVNALQTKLSHTIAAGVGQTFTNQPWNVSILLVVMAALIVANIMPGVAACCIFLPFVISMAVEPDAPVPWPKRAYLGALGVGVASSFTFLFPFLNTPAYFCRKTGKVPIKKMVKYSFISLIICGIVLWLALCFWAPVIWDPTGEGFSPVASPQAEAGEKAPSAPAPAEGAPDVPPPPPPPPPPPAAR
ncbi:unnamed protein product, partial [Iphiclides podalirius]